MTDTPLQDRDAFVRIVRDGLRKAELHTAGLRNRNHGLLMVSIVSSASTALVAGGTALAGPTLEIGVNGWRLACIVAAALAFLSTLTTALNQQLKMGDRLSQGYQCVSRLRPLDVNIAVGGHSWEEISREYGDNAKTYPEHFA
jgi:hypothetical protein